MHLIKKWKWICLNVSIAQNSSIINTLVVVCCNVQNGFNYFRAPFDVA